MGKTLPHYWTTKELAEAVPPKPEVNESTPRRWCASGRLQAYQVGRVWLIPDEEVEQFIAELQKRVAMIDRFALSTGVSMAAATTWKTGCSSILSVIDRFTTLTTTVHRCVLQWAFEMLEPLTVKVVRAVPRGGGSGNATPLPDATALAGPNRVRQ